MKRTLFIIPLLSILLTGCITTNIELPPVNNDLKRLYEANNNPVCINIEAPQKKLLGHQFVFPFFPVGKVVLEDSQKLFVTTSLYKNLTIKHFTPIFNSQTCKNVINVKVNKISLSAYDFFVTRHIVAKINYEVIYIKNGQLRDSVENTVERSSFKRFAFKSELEYALDKALKKLGKEIIVLLSN